MPRSWLDAAPVGREDFLREGAPAQLTEDDMRVIDIWLSTWDAFELACLAAAVAQATHEGREFDHAEYQQIWRREALIELGKRHRQILAPILAATRDAYGRTS